MQPARKTSTSRRTEAMRWLAQGGVLPTSAMASMESPVHAAPTENSLRVAQCMVGGLPHLADSESRVRRLATKLDRLKELSAVVVAGK